MADFGFQTGIHSKAGIIDTPGHVSYWRQDDGLLIFGDVLFNMHLLTLCTGLNEPPLLFTRNPEQIRRSARKLAALQPAII